jgi:hypothetical protein
MEYVSAIIDFVKSDPAVGVFAALFVLSEALAAIPQLKDNSILQVAARVFKKLSGK